MFEKIEKRRGPSGVGFLRCSGRRHDDHWAHPLRIGRSQRAQILIAARFLLALFALTLLAQESGDLSQALRSSRQRIDNIDAQIVKLLNERAQVVRDVGEIKKRFHAPASAPGREEEVLRQVSSQAQAPLSPENVRKIYQAILAEMTSMEQKEIDKAPK